MPLKWKWFGPPENNMTSRRRILEGISAGVCANALSSCSSTHTLTNDISQLEQTRVAAIVPIYTCSDLQEQMLRPGWISVAGGQFSMGGQTSADQARQLNCDPYNKIVKLDPTNKTVRVQSGMRWRDLQDVLDPHNLSVKVMQSFSNFSVGGSVSVNCHGRYLGNGAIASTVRALQIVLPTGEVIEASRSSNSDIFSATIGGYGLIGAISEVELDLTDNCVMERTVEHIALHDYPAWFEALKSNPTAIMHNADLTPPNFDQPLAITYHTTKKFPTDDRRLLPHNMRYPKEQNAIWAFTELPAGAVLRNSVVKKKMVQQPRIVHRNFEASLDVASLEPRTRFMSTYLLQEYFIPVRHFVKFAQKMAAILKHDNTHTLNVSIRHAPADTTSCLRWATEEVFCFVLYYKQRRFPWSDAQTVPWTRALIDAALECQGRYYLPYRPHATREQFIQAYPSVEQFVRFKQEVDPNMRLTNHLWQRYMSYLI